MNGLSFHHQTQPCYQYGMLTNEEIERRRVAENARRRAAYAANPGKYREASKAWRVDHPGYGDKYRDPAKHRAQMKSARDADPEKFRARDKAKYAKHSAKIKAGMKALYDADPQKYRERKRAERLAEPEMARAVARARRQKDPEKFRAWERAYRAADPEKFRARYRANNIRYAETHKAYRKTPKFIAKNRANSAKVRALKLLATPSWSEVDLIKAFYAACPEGAHVDHWMPLQGRTVSGLHILSNLQYLPEKDNRAKKNNMPAGELPPFVAVEWIELMLARFYAARAADGLAS